MPGGLVHLNSLDRSFPIVGMSAYFLSLSWLTKIPVFNAKGVDLDKMLHLFCVYNVC